MCKVLSDPHAKGPQHLLRPSERKYRGVPSCVSGVIAGAYRYAGATASGSSGDFGVIHRLGVYAAYARGIGGFADEELLVDDVLQRGLDGGAGESVLRIGEAQREFLVVRQFEFDFQGLSHIHSSFL